MSKTIKALLREDLKRLYQGVDCACVVSLVGLKAGDSHRLRGRLRAKQMSLRVVKNTLARQAFAGGPLEALGNYLDGPCALVTGGASVIELARELVTSQREFPALRLKEGVIEGDRELIPILKIAQMKGRAETQGEVSMLFLSPGRRVAGCISGPAGRIGGCIRALADLLEKGQRVERQSA